MIVLTGGAGFIGSCFLKKLNDNGIDDIMVVDHLSTTDKWKNLSGKRFVQFEHKDKFRQKLLEDEYLFDFDAIIHFGACSKTTERNADYIMDNNLGFSIDVAEYCIDHEARFIYASSASTYGNGEFGYSDSVFEPLKPLNVYGLSKHIFDLWVIKNGYQDEFAGFKFFNVFGPNEYHKGDMASMIFKAHKQIKETGKVNLFKSNHTDYPDGGQMRDFVYVKDVVDIIWQTFQNDDINGIFNLGTGNARSWNDLANAVYSAMEIKPDINYVDMPDSLINQYQNYTQAEMNKLSEQLADFKFMSLEDSVKDYISEYLDKNYLIY
jgi:ADP-L-glycero-D-manno-heptose 6-epimerase